MGQPSSPGSRHSTEEGAGLATSDSDEHRTGAARPRVLLLNQYFWPDRAATAQLLSDLGNDLVDAGFEVTALASRGVYSSDRSRLPGRESWAGISVHRLPATSLGRGSTWRRLADYLSFYVSAALWLLPRRFDLVVCLSTPPMVASLGLLARLRGAAFVYKVEDLYPDLAVALGKLEGSSPLVRLLDRMSRAILRRGSRVVALDDRMAAVLKEKGARKVVVIPNWADGEAIRPDPAAGGRFRRAHGLSEAERVVLYSGNLGLAHRFDAVTAAAHRCHEAGRPIRFLFVGGGPRLDEVRAASVGLPNCTFLPYQPRETLHELYNAADLHLVTLRDEVEGLLVPSKYAAALAGGKPVLLVGAAGSDMAAEIARERVGWACRHDAEEVLSALEAATHEQLDERGARARDLFERRYSRAEATGRWAQLLRNVLATGDLERSPAPAPPESEK